MNEMTKPTRMLLVVSGLVIFFSLFLIAVAIASLIVASDPFSVVAAAVTLPVTSVMAVQQYRGTFRRVRSAASASSLLLFVVGAFAIFAFVTTVGEIAVAGANLPWLSLLLPMLVIAVVTLCGGWLNWDWQRKLPEFLADEGWRFTLRDAIAATTAICFLTAVSSSLVRSIPPRHAENAKVTEAPFGLPGDG